MVCCDISFFYIVQKKFEQFDANFFHQLLDKSPFAQNLNFRRVFKVQPSCMILRMNISIFQVVSEALMTLREHKSLLLRRIQKMKSTFLLWKVDPTQV